MWRAAVCCCVLLLYVSLSPSATGAAALHLVSLLLLFFFLLLTHSHFSQFSSLSFPFSLLLVLFLFHFLSRQIYMFSDMWMWEEAKRFAEHTPQIDLSELNRKQALSLERINAWEEAAQMHAASQDYARAIQIFAQVRFYIS